MRMPRFAFPVNPTEVQAAALASRQQAEKL